MKEWLKVTHSAAGTLVTVTLQDGNLTVKWQTKASTAALKPAVTECREWAAKMLAELREAAEL